MATPQRPPFRAVTSPRMGYFAPLSPSTSRHSSVTSLLKSGLRTPKPIDRRSAFQASAPRESMFPQNPRWSCPAIFNDPSRHLEWDQLPVPVTSEATDWPPSAGRPPRAGVSSFGLQGTNAHIVVEGYLEPHRVTRATREEGVTEGVRPPEARANPIVVPMPEPFAHLPPAAGDFAPRTARVLPLSG